VRRGLTGLFRGFKPADAESAFKFQRSQIDIAVQDADAELQIVRKDHDFSPLFRNYARLPPSYASEHALEINSRWCLHALTQRDELTVDDFNPKSFLFILFSIVDVRVISGVKRTASDDRT
jgi:hypothetical protein